MRNSLLALIGAACLSVYAPAGAQDLKIPQPSTGQQIDQDFGLGKITISYSRPNTKGRTIFGHIEPYGQVWRTGANWATRIKLTDSLRMAGHAVAPGDYSLFTIPGPDEWVVILNNTAQQWGAYTYDSTKDLLRFAIRPRRLDKPVETFTIEFANMTVEHGELQLAWENVLLPIPLETNVDAAVMANIDKAMMGAKKPYYSAAVYYYNHDKDMHKALEWMGEMDKAQPNQFNIKYWIARIKLKLGDKAGAVAAANEGLTLATQHANTEYIRMNKEALADAQK